MPSRATQAKNWCGAGFDFLSQYLSFRSSLRITRVASLRVSDLIKLVDIWKTWNLVNLDLFRVVSLFFFSAVVGDASWSVSFNSFYISDAKLQYTSTICSAMRVNYNVILWLHVVADTITWWFVTLLYESVTFLQYLPFTSFANANLKILLPYNLR